MTREEKVTWFMNVSGEEVLKWAVIAMIKADSVTMQVEDQEDYELALAELKRRLSQ